MTLKLVAKYYPKSWIETQEYGLGHIPYLVLYLDNVFNFSKTYFIIYYYALDTLLTN